MNTELMFSSKTDLWSTPQDFFNELDREFHFGIDVCATEENAKCKNFYDKKTDGLKQNWGGYGTIWCNPPYGKEIACWVEKAAQTSQSGETVVMLLPARTDTKWFHEYIYNKAEIRFVKGRLKFGDAKASAPFPSMIVVFRN